MTTPTLGDLIAVADVETVVRLDGSGGRLGQLVLTGDVTRSLTTVLEAGAASTSEGAAFFVVGPFGSGKSHFLAAVGELLADPAGTGTVDTGPADTRAAAPADAGAAPATDARATPEAGATRVGAPPPPRARPRAGWTPALVELAGNARRCTAIAVPLVEYRAQTPLEDVVRQRAWRFLAQPPPPSNGDRAEDWNTFLDAARADHPATGLVILIDELSEWLRAKQGPALTEDLRFLQFLGEWTRDHPVVVLAALQESIEEVANVSERELTRIRDRFRPSLALSMRHVEDLVRGRLVRLRPDAEPWVDRAWHEVAAAFPMAGFSRERFARCYPLHPATLDLLEGLRFLLSQQRGVVDFISRRLHDSLDRGYAELITPDEVFDHFRDRLRQRPDTARLADTVVPYYERTAAELVDEEDQALALRTVKLLCLQAASPLERPRSAAELAPMLLTRASALDPAANAAYLEQAVLAPITAGGSYVVGKGKPVAQYRVVLDADAAVVARALAEQSRNELTPGDRRMVTTLLRLGESPTLPLQLQRDIGWSRRELMWENTPRALTVGLVRLVELGVEEATAIVERARATGAEGCLLIGELELEGTDEARSVAEALVAGIPRLAAWVPDALTPDELTALREIHSRQLALASASAGGRSDVAEVLEQSVASDQAVAREILRRAYFQGVACYAPGPDPDNAGPMGKPVAIDLPSLAALGFERALTGLADPLLRGLHPRHAQVMPRGELVAERTVRDLLNEMIVPGRVGAAALSRGQLRTQVQGYLVPLGLAKVRSDGAVLSPDPAHSIAVAEVLRLVGDGSPIPAPEVVAALADGPLGLTGNESALVLNACVQSGLLEMQRGRRRFSEPFVAVTASDRFCGGELVERSVRDSVARMGGVAGPGPFDPWNAATQREAWDRSKAWLTARREDVGEVRAGLLRLADVAVLASADPTPVFHDAEAVEAVLDACPASDPAPTGLRRLAATVSDPPSTVAAARRLSAVARFLRDDVRRAEEAALYLTHPDMAIPTANAELCARREAALDHLRSSLQMAAEDRAGDVFQAYREFRSAFVAAYHEAHDRYYGAVRPADVERVRTSPAYAALAHLAAMGATSARDDIRRVDRLLAAAAPTPCRARVDVALQWKPRCQCGFAMGDREPALDSTAIVAIAEQGVGQHLSELARPETRDRLADAVSDLQSLGQSELARDLARLVDLAAQADTRSDATARDATDSTSPAPAATAAPAADDLAEVARLVRPDGGLPAVVRDVITRGQLIVTRDLASLREDLAGRRYTKRRLVEMLTGWVDPGGDLPFTAHVDVVDGAAAVPPSEGNWSQGTYEQTAFPTGNGATGADQAAPTVAFLSARFPSIAALLPDHQAADSFWLAAWWAGRPGAPSWIPARLLAQPSLLVAAAQAALLEPAVAAELADLDRRIGPDTALGDRMAVALNVTHLAAKEVAAVLSSERMFHFPIRLAADQFLRRLAGDWQLVSLLSEGDLASHATVAGEGSAALRHLLDAARNLAALEQALPDTDCRSLVEDIYPRWYVPVREQIDRARLAAAVSGSVEGETIDAFDVAARRLLRRADQSFAAHADADYPGCLPAWQVGTEVVAALLQRYGRAAILLVDAMRADLGVKVSRAVGEALPDRNISQRWTVTPAPTRTAEAVAALHLGRPVPGGSAGPHPADAIPFSHLGYEARSLLRADRDDQTEALRHLLASGPPMSVAVATGVDERLHHSTVELAALLDESVASLCRRVVPALSALPDRVPLVLLADHGFRENPSWGHGPEGRYVHGGTSLEECVTPVVVFEPPTK